MIEVIYHERRFEMPILSAFYGLAIYMYDEKRGKHNKPHIHIYYSGEDIIKIDPLR